VSERVRWPARDFEDLMVVEHAASGLAAEGMDTCIEGRCLETSAGARHRWTSPALRFHPGARRLPRLPAPPHRRDPGRTTGGLSDGPPPVPEGNRPAPRHRPGDAEPVGTRAPGSGRSICPAARGLPGTARRHSAQSPRFVARPRLTVVASWTYWSRPPWPAKRPDAATQIGNYKIRVGSHFGLGAWENGCA